MAAVTIIRPDSTALVFDGVVSYRLDSRVTVTDHPVEDGVDVSDHAQIQPKGLAIRGIVTETPYSDRSSSGGPDHVRAALDFLDAARGERLTVVTERFGTLEDMALTAYPTTADNVRRLVFDVELRQIRVATATLITIAPTAPTTTAAAASLPDEQDVGEQPTGDTAEEPAQEEADKTLLLTLFEATGVEV